MAQILRQVVYSATLSSTRLFCQLDRCPPAVVNQCARCIFSSSSAWNRNKSTDENNEEKRTTETSEQGAKSRKHAAREIAIPGKEAPTTKVNARFLVRVLKGETDLGVCSLGDAQLKAKSFNLKLVKWDSSKDPPIFRMVTGEELFAHQKELRQQKKQIRTGKPSKTKQVVLHPGITDQDLSIKCLLVEKWLSNGYTVKFNVDGVPKDGVVGDVLLRVSSVLEEKFPGKLTINKQSSKMTITIQSE